jgi:hypothetical protein
MAKLPIFSPSTLARGKEQEKTLMVDERTRAANPLVFGQSGLAYVDQEAVDLPRTTADGKPVIDLTPEQRYLFDTRGWLLIPGLLNAAEVEEMRAFCYRLHDDPESLPEVQRCPIAGPLEPLMDHPFVVGFMNEFLAHPDLTSQDCYGFRMESSHLHIRRKGDGRFAPHNGNGLHRLPGDSHHYRCTPGLARSGLTCVLWELDRVEQGGGGTLFIDGSHKAAFLAPDSVSSPDSPLWSSYSCPEGSLIIFAEGTTHSAMPWATSEQDRVCIFSRYNYVNSRWHNWEPPAGLLESMPHKRRTLFRGVHVQNNLVNEA